MSWLRNLFLTPFMDSVNDDRERKAFEKFYTELLKSEEFREYCRLFHGTPAAVYSMANIEEMDLISKLIKDLCLENQLTLIQEVGSGTGVFSAHLAKNLSQFDLVTSDFTETCVNHIHSTFPHLKPQRKTYEEIIQNQTENELLLSIDGLPVGKRLLKILTQLKPKRWTIATTKLSVEECDLIENLFDHFEIFNLPHDDEKTREQIMYIEKYLPHGIVREAKLKELNRILKDKKKKRILISGKKKGLS